VSDAPADLLVLQQVDLVPVLKVEPGRSLPRQGPLPSRPVSAVPNEWHHFWLDSLAAAGMAGLKPLRLGSWNVSTRQLTDPVQLAKLLAALVEQGGGKQTLADPNGVPGVEGGLALCRGEEVLVEPGCCGDLRDLEAWRQAAAYRGADWQMVWIGHPWMSVRFLDGWLILSQPHEGDAPVAHWAVTPAELDRAVAEAEAEREEFARRLQPAVAALGMTDTAVIARKLAGLTG